MLDSDILNWPIEIASGLTNRWARVILTFFGIIFWVIPILLVFIMPLLVWSAFNGD